jgi:hypothetical protein
MAVFEEGTLFCNVLTSLKLINFLLSKPLSRRILEEIPSLSNSFEQGLDEDTIFEIISLIRLFFTPNQILYIKIINLLT